MAAYVVFIRSETTDAGEMATYAGLAPMTFAGHSVTPVVRYGKFETLEGAPIEGVAIVQFPTIAEAKAWYNSPEYQAAAVHRHRGAKYQGFIVEGV